MSCLGHQPCLSARYWSREARSLCGCFVRRWVRTCPWSIPGLNLSDFLLIGPYLDRLVLYRERGASIDCLWPECRIANLSKNDARALNELKCDKSIGNLPVGPLYRGHEQVGLQEQSQAPSGRHDCLYSGYGQSSFRCRQSTQRFPPPPQGREQDHPQGTTTDEREG